MLRGSDQRVQPHRQFEGILSCRLLPFSAHVLSCSDSIAFQLQALLLYTTEALSAHGVDYWLDYGSLLGAVRDRGIVPWDVDVVGFEYRSSSELRADLQDMSVREEDCNRILQLRPQFLRERGFEMFGRGEKVPQMERAKCDLACCSAC